MFIGMDHERRQTHATTDNRCAFADAFGPSTVASHALAPCRIDGPRGERHVPLDTPS